MGTQCLPDITSFEAMSTHVHNLVHVNPGNEPDKVVKRSTPDKVEVVQIEKGLQYGARPFIWHHVYRAWSNAGIHPETAATRQPPTAIYEAALGLLAASSPFEVLATPWRFLRKPISIFSTLAFKSAYLPTKRLSFSGSLASPRKRW